MKIHHLMLLTLVLLVGSSLTYYALADGPYLNIPPTNAYVNITASNGSTQAPNWYSTVHFQGLGGLVVKASNSSQTVYFTSNLVNGTTITPLTCALNSQLHSVTLSGVFTCAINNSTGSSSTLDTMQNLKPSQAAIYSGNNTNINFQFKGLNFTGSLSAINGSSIITIHGNIYQNNTGLNIGKGGKGLYAGMLLDKLQFRNITCDGGLTCSINGTDFRINSTALLSAITTSQNIGHASGSFGVLSTPTSNAIRGKNITGINGVITSGNITDITISNSSPLSSLSFANIGHGGKGSLASITGTTLNNKNITSDRPDLFTVGSNATDVKLSSSFKSNTIGCNVNSFISKFVNSTGSYTCTFDGPNGTLNINSTQNNIATSTNNLNGFVQVQKFSNLPLGSLITSVSLNVTTSAGNVRVKIYQDDGSGSSPSTLLGESNSIATGGTGVRTFPLSTQAKVQPSGNIYAGFETDNAALKLYLSGGGGPVNEVSHVYGSGPNPFGTVSTIGEAFWMKITYYAVNGTELNTGFFKSNSITCTNQFISAFNNVTGLYSCASVPSSLSSSQNIGKGTGSFGVLAAPTSSLVRGKNITCSTGMSCSGNTTDITLSNTITQGVTSFANIGKGGKGVLSSITSNSLKSKNITSDRPDLFTVGSNNTDIKLSSNFKSDTFACSTANNFFVGFVNTTGVFNCLPGWALNGNNNVDQSIVGTLNNVTITNGTIGGFQSIKINTGSNIVTTGQSAQEITKALTIDKLIDLNTFIVDDGDNTKKLGWQLSGMTTGITTTIRNNATSSQGFNIPVTRETETYAVRAQSNFTSPGNKTGTTSAATVMWGGYITLTPQVTGTIDFYVTGQYDNSVVTDGCRIDVRESTTNMGVNGAVAAGTVIGTNLKVTSPTASSNSTFSKIVEATGLTKGTKTFWDLGFNRLVGGTCTLRNVDMLIKEAN